jgi:hypothetical protein
MGPEEKLPEPRGVSAPPEGSPGYAGRGFRRGWHTRCEPRGRRDPTLLPVQVVKIHQLPPLAIMTNDGGAPTSGSGRTRGGSAECPTNNALPYSLRGPKSATPWRQHTPDPSVELISFKLRVFHAVASLPTSQSAFPYVPASSSLRDQVRMSPFPFWLINIFAYVYIRRQKRAVTVRMLPLRQTWR